MFDYTKFDESKAEFVEIAPVEDLPGGERLFVELLHIFERLADNRFDQQVRGGLRDGTAVTVETGIFDGPISGCLERDLDMVAAQRIVVSKENIVRVKTPTITGVLVVLDDDFAIEIVHR